MSPRKCPGCGKRRKLIPITAGEARRFGPRLTGPQPQVGSLFCAACITNPPPGVPIDTVADLIHVATLCHQAAKDLTKNPAVSQIAISVALDLLRDISSRTP